MKVIYIFILTIILFSCGRGPKKEYPVKTYGKLVAVVKNRDSTKSLMVIGWALDTVGVLVDSVKRIWQEKIDTVYGKPTIIPLRDSTGKIILDSLGKPKLNPEPVYLKISKDSVNWHIEGKDIDSLLKKN